MWFLGAGTSRSAGLPTANDIIWDLKLKYYSGQENHDVKAHDINNKAIMSKIQSFLDSRKSQHLEVPRNIPVTSAWSSGMTGQRPHGCSRDAAATHWMNASFMSCTTACSIRLGNWRESRTARIRI